MELTQALTRTSPLLLISRFVMGDVRTLGRKLKRSLTGEEVRYVARAHYEVPDSALCQKALDLVAASSPDFLLNHCLRSFAFGKAIAEKSQTRFDAEVFFAAAIMHDLGLTERFDGPGSFETEGARVARAFCIDRGMESARADIVHEAVALHAAVGIAHKKSTELALLHFGAGVDVAGFWMDEVHPRTVQEIVERYPRLDFKKLFPALLERQVDRKPDCHIAGLVNLGFCKKIKASPFSE